MIHFACVCVYFIILKLVHPHVCKRDILKYIDVKHNIMVCCFCVDYCVYLHAVFAINAQEIFSILAVNEAFIAIGLFVLSKGLCCHNVQEGTW